MKVLAINGSPKSEGNTAQALRSVLHEVERGGVATELLTIGHCDIHGCIACGRCAERRNGRCVAFDDAVNELMPKMIAADALLLGSPVYFCGINGTLKSFLDRTFFVSWVNGGLLRLKLGASVVAVRRSGGTAAFDQLNKYFQISEMMTVGSCYWNVAHGFSPGEVAGDPEGVNILKTLGRNLLWMLRLIAHGKGKIMPPESPDPVITNFVR